jgi:hypothetical protein
VDKKLSFFVGEKWDTIFEYIFNILPGSGFVLIVQRLYLEQTTTNTGILHYVQDDDFRVNGSGDDVETTMTKQATTKQATTNAGILHCVQDDSIIAASRMTASLLCSGDGIITLFGMKT